MYATNLLKGVGVCCSPLRKRYKIISHEHVEAADVAVSSISKVLFATWWKSGTKNKPKLRRFMPNFTTSSKYSYLTSIQLSCTILRSGGQAKSATEFWVLWSFSLSKVSDLKSPANHRSVTIPKPTKCTSSAVWSAIFGDLMTCRRLMLQVPQQVVLRVVQQSWLHWSRSQGEGIHQSQAVDFRFRSYVDPMGHPVGCIVRASVKVFLQVGASSFEQQIALKVVLHQPLKCDPLLCFLDC